MHLFKELTRNLLEKYRYILNRTNLDKVQKEHDQVFMVKIAESDKLHNAEQKLYETTARLDSSDQANMRLRLKLEETRNKLESGTFLVSCN